MGTQRQMNYRETSAEICPKERLRRTKVPNPHPRNTLRRHQGKQGCLRKKGISLGRKDLRGPLIPAFACLEYDWVHWVSDALEKCSSITLFRDRGEKSEVGNRVWSRSSGEEAPTPANTAQSLPCSQQPQGALQANPRKARSRNPSHTSNPGGWKCFAHTLLAEGEKKAQWQL